jgi:tight adherence protein C
MARTTLLESKPTPVASRPTHSGGSDSTGTARRESTPIVVASLDETRREQAAEPSALFGGMTAAMADVALPAQCWQQMRAQQRAGQPGLLAWQNFAAARYAGVMIPLVVFGSLLVAVPPAFELVVGLLLIVSCGVGGWLPTYCLRKRIAARTSQLEQGLPDLVDLLALSVEQGRSVRDSLQPVTVSLRFSHPALFGELTLLWQQARLDTLEGALQLFAERHAEGELHEFGIMLAQSERLGAASAQQLVSYGEQLRKRLQQRAHACAIRTLVLQALCIVLCLLPGAGWMIFCLFAAR